MKVEVIQCTAGPVIVITGPRRSNTMHIERARAAWIAAATLPVLPLPLWPMTTRMRHPFPGATPGPMSLQRDKQNGPTGRADMLPPRPRCRSPPRRPSPHENRAGRRLGVHSDLRCEHEGAGLLSFRGAFAEPYGHGTIGADDERQVIGIRQPPTRDRIKDRRPARLGHARRSWSRLTAWPCCRYRRAWWQGVDLHHRSPGYEPDELLLLHPAQTRANGRRGVPCMITLELRPDFGTLPEATVIVQGHPVGSAADR